MTEFRLDTSVLRDRVEQLRAGDRVLLSGTVYTSRDAAHKRIFELLDSGGELPYEINGAVVYYAGPTPTRPDGRIGSFGPTTASRMDRFSPRLLDLGLLAMIGKGSRSEEVRQAIVRNGAVYLCAEGGCGALISRCIKSCEEIGFLDLGCESVKRLVVADLPLTVGIDCQGNNIFEMRNKIV